MARLRLRTAACALVACVCIFLVLVGSGGRTGGPGAADVPAPSVRPLPADAGRARPAAPRVAIVTYDVAGPLLNGGIGTAYAALACALGGAGMDVTLALALGPRAAPASGRTWAQWVAHFRASCNVALDALPAPPALPPPGALAEAERAHAALLWLRDREAAFDVVHFHEWRGIGAMVAAAKRQGMLFARTLLVVGAHSPSVWAAWGNLGPPTVAELQVDHLERESVRLADVLVSPSRYMVDWMLERRWRLPARTLVHPNIADAQAVRDAAAPGPPTPAAEFVFFGRLEVRKGFDLLVDAVLHLQRQHGFRPNVTLLGKVSDRGGTRVQAALRMFPDWRLLSNRSVDEAAEYLAAEGRVALMPSLSDNSPYTILECMARGIPFLASDVGGNGELVLAEDRPRVLFRPDHRGLAEAMLAAKQRGVPRARPALPFAGVREAWVSWHARLPAPPPAPPPPPLPRVSVVLAVFSTAHVGDIVRSIASQAYPSVELVAVCVGLGDGDLAAARTAIGTGIPGIQRIVTEVLPRTTAAASWNRGRQIAAGSLLVFMENDALLTDGYFRSIATAFARTGAAALTSVMDGVPPSSSSLADAPPKRRWYPIGASLPTAGFRNPFGDPPFAITAHAFDAAKGFREELAMCSHLDLLSRVSLMGLDVQVAALPVLRKSEAYPVRLQELSWTELAAEKELAFRPFEDNGAADALPAVRDWDPDRPPSMPEYCLAVVPERSAAVVARQVDRSESGGASARRLVVWRSDKQFSKHQGSLGWSYGYRRRAYGNETDEGFVPFADTRQVDSAEGEPQLEHWTQAHRFPKQLAASATAQHPAVALRLTGRTSKHVFVAVRRWQGFFAGSLSVKGTVSRAAACGDGVRFRLVADGRVEAEHTLLPGAGPGAAEVALEMEVSVGSVLEFQVDPLADDECDSTGIEFQLRGLPDQGL
ncbi:hypothetical protein DFJ74DRAFT_770148 [Hyaloraphidium curvatum]|nr:hypothetical protein DFJ74DRAFT_770148 [Hyaloraphidium curvatum]